MRTETQTQADTPEKASKGSVKMPALNEYYKFLKSDKQVRASPEKRSRSNDSSTTTPHVAARGRDVETTTKSRYDFFSMLFLYRLFGAHASRDSD